ncbi:hypothetical protein [Gordonia sp. 4N]|nr:hypothetical protein [Gordonia sp. 4N]MCX2756757.1 hypothetical protein [Gordonia sp. 4N]
MNRCDRGRDQILTQNSSVPVADNWVDGDDYFRTDAGQSGYFFQVADGQFFCAITGTPGRAAAGCQQSPVTTTRHTTDSETTTITTESIQGRPGNLGASSEPQYQFAGEGSTLPLSDHQRLFVNGYTCSVDYHTTITCWYFATNHGFTVSADSYRLF